MQQEGKGALVGDRGPVGGHLVRALIAFLFVAPLSTLVAQSALPSAGQPPAQTVQRSNADGTSSLSLSFTGTTSQSVADDAGPSASSHTNGTPYGSFAPGFLARYERSYRWWAGYSLNYGQGRAIQIYNNTPYIVSPAFLHAEVPAMVHDISAAYLVRARSFFWNIRPFAELGAGAMIFDPTSAGVSGIRAGGQFASIRDSIRDVPNVVTQTRFTGNATAGFSVDVKKHVGIQASYRTFAYVAPTFHTGNTLGDKQYTIAQEPSAGLVIKF